MNKKLLIVSIAAVVLIAAGISASIAYADHSWGNYHWARTANPLALNLGDNVSTIWDDYLAIASTDWSVSSVLNTMIVAGRTTSDPKKCRPTSGRIEVCSANYGGAWLGLAQIWVSGGHIYQATTKVNDFYFNKAKYNTPAWKQFVMCQEVGHTFGLAHQDEIFNNANLGSCMDYTNDPDGGAGGASATDPSNERPNTHDYGQLVTIYTHLEAFTSALSKKFSEPAATNDDIDTSDAKEWGKVIRKSSDGRSSLHERDLGKGNKIFTFVIWANQD